MRSFPLAHNAYMAGSRSDGHRTRHAGDFFHHPIHSPHFLVFIRCCSPYGGHYWIETRRQSGHFDATYFRLPGLFLSRFYFEIIWPTRSSQTLLFAVCSDQLATFRAASLSLKWPGRMCGPLQRLPPNSTTTTITSCCGLSIIPSQYPKEFNFMVSETEAVVAAAAVEPLLIRV